MADAKTAIMITLDPAHEGGFQKNPHDHANWSSGQIGVGVLVGTNGGITALDMPGADIEHLTTDQKVAYYLEHYWKPLYSQIISQLVANKIFDLGVLFGVGTAVHHFQAALNTTPPDGVFGPMTLHDTNQDNPARLLAAFKAEMHGLADRIGAKNPNEVADVPDWHRRIDS